MKITNDILKTIYPQSTLFNRSEYLPFFNLYLDDYEINTPVRLQYYFAQIGHESAQLLYSEEIASGEAYEGRKDLGNLQVGDGIKFKGRGLIQITGRFNYEKLSETYHVDFIKTPELLSTPDWAVKSSLWFWEYNDLNHICDQNDFKLLTKRINGGFNGFSERLILLNLCKQVFV